MLKLSASIILLVAISIGTFAIAGEVAHNVKLKQLQAVKVFQIGFNKCGTTTLADFFNINGVKSVHYDDGKIAIDIWNNYLSHKPLISVEYDHYYGYFDMQNIHTHPPIFIAQKLFKELDRQYPGSKFILNTRDRASWLKSRSAHKTMYGISYLALNVKKYKISEDVVLKMWIDEWDKHFLAVREYFKDRPNDLLIFDIEKDRPEKLRDFFKDNFVLDTKLYKHKNKTHKK